MLQNWRIWKICEFLVLFIRFFLIFHVFRLPMVYGEEKGGPLWVSSLFVSMYLEHTEKNIEKNYNDFSWVFGNREWKDPVNWTCWWHVPAVVAGTCHHRSLTDDMKHQVALNSYELDVFSIAGLGRLCPQRNPGGSGGQHPPAKTEKNEKEIEEFQKKKLGQPPGYYCY